MRRWMNQMYGASVFNDINGQISIDWNYTYKYALLEIKSKLSSINTNKNSKIVYRLLQNQTT